MDNLTHTLVGAALAESGLGRRSALATATLLVAANLPDVDGILYWLARPDLAYGFRRGWTHGILALALWPFLLVGAMLAWDRWVRRRLRPGAAPAVPRALLAVAFLGLLTHPLLDWFNTYGMRWLMPFSGRWSYGDVWFIADPWVWLVLGVGWWRSRRRRQRDAPHPARAARAALAVVACYAAAMFVAGRIARGVAERALAGHGLTAVRVMASPEPLTPFRRRIVADVGAGYALGTVDFLRRPAFTADGEVVPKGDRAPEVARAEREPAAATFLRWARFPVFRVDTTRAGTLVHIVDLRYARAPGAGFGALTVPIAGR